MVKNKMDEIPDTNLRNRVSTFGITFLKPKLFTALLLMICGALSSLAFAPFELPVIWLLWIPLVWSSQYTWFKSYRSGWYFGFGHFFVNLFWLHSIHPAAIFPIAIVCAIFMGIWVLLFSRIQRYLPNRPFLQLISGIGLWLMCDWLRGYVFTGFPWNFVGTTLWQNPDPGIVRIGGIYGQSAVIVTLGLFLALFIKQWIETKLLKETIIKHAYNALFVCISMLTVFGLNKSVDYGTFDGEINILAAQGNIPLCREYTDNEFTNARDTYLELTQIPKGQQVDLIIWPETAVPAPVSTSRYYYKLRNKIQSLQIPLLVGTVDYRRDKQKPLSSSYKTFNSAMLFDKTAQQLAVYDKTHPVPFGEFVPLQQYFPSLEKIIGMGRSLTAGTEYLVFDQFAPAKFGVNICYEDVFPEISRQFVLNGANFISTITNDAWYNETAGSRQHFSNSVFRGIENGVYFLRSGNRSYTSLTSPWGEQVQMIRGENGEYFTAASKVFTIPFSTERTPTFYTTYGDLFTLVWSLIALAILALSLKHWYLRRLELMKILIGKENV